MAPPAEQQRSFCTTGRRAFPHSGPLQALTLAFFGNRSMVHPTLVTSLLALVFLLITTIFVGIEFELQWFHICFLSILDILLVAYVVVVVWNPFVRDILLGTLSVSPAAKTCTYNPRNPPDWHTLGEIESRVSSRSFYSQYHGHLVHQLVRVRKALATAGCCSFIYLCGDSSLDNKHWFFSPFKVKERQMNDNFTAPAVNGYEDILISPARMVKDVSFYLNAQAAERFGPGNVCTIMTSVEESTLEDRGVDGLLVQDAFIRDHITPQDYLIVSLGGNDIALRPTLRTAFNVAVLTLSPKWIIRMGWAPGMGYLVSMFHDKMQSFVKR